MESYGIGLAIEVRLHDLFRGRLAALRCLLQADHVAVTVHVADVGEIVDDSQSSQVKW